MATEIDEGATIVARNPANMQELGRVFLPSAEEIRCLVDRSRKAFQSWRLVDIGKRLELIETFGKILFESKDELSALITAETGKPRSEVLISEIFAVLEVCTWLKKNAARVLAPEKVELNPLFFAGKHSYNVFEPMGVIAVISPYNYPFSIPVSTMLHALVAGNGVVLKPSPKTALTASATVDLFRRAGFSQDLVGLVQGDRTEAVELINSSVSRVMFTGSVTGGKAIMALAATKLLPVTLELGGKHAAIVLEDSDIDKIAAPLVWGAFTNAGQACASIDRIYVVKPLAEKLAAKIAGLSSRLRLGDGMLPDTDVGPLVDAQQLERVKGLLEEAVSLGARLLCGGSARLDLGGYFLEPTVLADVTPSMKIVSEEIFGPVLSIVAVDDAEQGVALANESSLGLGASIWSADLKRAEELARGLEAGMVWINDGLYSHVCPDAPWGGIKDSGFGRMHSAIELRDLVYVKNIGVGKQGVRQWNFPYNQNRLDFISGALGLLYRRGLLGRFKALVGVIRAYVKLNGS